MTSSSSSKKLTILFIPLDGYGHIHACVGVAERLLAHGHRVIFALEHAWRGTASRYHGIEEVHFIDPARGAGLGANDYWIQYMLEFKREFRLEPLEAVSQKNLQLEEDFLFHLLNVDHELKRIIDELNPDIIVVDVYVTIPAVVKSNIPWVWLASAAPLSCLPSDDLPPTRSGYPTNGDRSLWKEFIEIKQSVMAPVIEKVKHRLQGFNLPPEAQDTLMCHSPYLNIYAYPEELDYLPIRPLPANWKRFDHFIRFSEPDSDFEIPKEFLEKPQGKLVYVSMGSMGCADSELMSWLIGILGKSPNRFIFSLGPLERELKPIMSDNMWGARFVPQTQILRQVDLVITHGGNNTFIESIYYGVPMVVVPLFADQLDNAQRITECGLGQRVKPFKCETQELLSVIERLLSDQRLNSRLKTISARMQTSYSTERAACAIENVLEVDK